MTTPTAEESRALLETLTGYTRGPWRCSRPDMASYDAATGKQVSFLYLNEGERVRFATDHPVEDARVAAAAPDLVVHLRAALEREAFWKRDSERAWGLFWGNDA